MTGERVRRAALALRRAVRDVVTDPKKHLLPWPFNDESPKTRAATYVLARVLSVHGLVAGVLYDIGRHAIKHYRDAESDDE